MARGRRLWFGMEKMDKLITYEEYFAPEHVQRPYLKEWEMTEELLCFLDACLETAFCWKENGFAGLELRGVVVTPQEAEEALNARHRRTRQLYQEAAPLMETQRREFSKMEAHIKSRARLSKARGFSSRFWELIGRSRLMPVEQFCFLMALAVEYDRKYERLYGYLQDNVAAKLPTVGLGVSLYNFVSGKGRDAIRLRKAGAIWGLLEPPETLRPQESTLSLQMSVRGQVLGWLWGEDGELKDYGVLGQLAVQIPPAFGWDDIVLGVRQKKLLQQLKNRVMYQKTVMGQWGFEKKIAYGTGISALFYGPPGTGKTMGAQVIAADLKLPLYRIDISRIASKYIGETEKNLGLLFDEANRRNIILFFDEADTLFAKRSGISNSNDRYANMETGYLLQKIEEYKGIAILATNYLENIDSAFQRRIQYIIHFPFPDEAMRLQLWKKSFPENAPMEDDVDFSFYAKKYELSGSSIKETALNSAYLAAAQGESIHDSHIKQALEFYFEKMGIHHMPI